MVKNNSSVNTGEIVLSAIKKLTKNTGWTTRTIIKFIKLEYNIPDPKFSRKISRALKRGLKLGLLQIEQGRYRLSEMSYLARKVRSHEVRKRYKPKQRSRMLRIKSSRSFSKKPVIDYVT